VTYGDERLTKLARQMVYLEWRAKFAEAAGDQEQVLEFWQTREWVQHRRSVLLREAWAKRREGAHA